MIAGNVSIFLKGILHRLSWSLLKKSLLQAMAFLGVASTFMGVAGISVADVAGDDSSWTSRLLFIVCIYCLFAFAALVINYLRCKDGLHIEIGGTDVEVAVGDLFTADGVRVIPFDEYFDIQVDDKVISRNSLNGIFVEQYADWETLSQTVDEVQPSAAGEPESIGGRLRYPLGTVKAYDDYALLALTHMDNMNRAHLRHGQYEECLLNMWADLNRMYAGRRVVLPLLGSGITRFEGGKPTEDDLLRCMLCTLRASKQHFKDGVLIVLTKKTAERMRLYEVEDYALAWNQRIGEKDGL